MRSSPAGPWARCSTPTPGRSTAPDSATIGLTPALTLYLFSVLPTSNLDDNVTNTAPIFADLANFVGKIDLPAMDNQGGMSESMVVEGSGNLPLAFECASGRTHLIGIVVCQGNFTNEIDDDELTIKLTRELL